MRRIVTLCLVSAVGLLLTPMAAAEAVAPTLTNFTPGDKPAGTSVGIAGTDFDMDATTGLMGVTNIDGGAALALPANAPDATAQTDGIVRAIAQAGNLIWVGGQFSHVKDANGTIVATVSDIAAFDATTGANATPSTVASLTGSGSIVYDLSFDPGTNTLYVGGLFTAGTAKNLVALDATTGAIKKSFSAPKLFSVLASGANVYGGGAALNAWVASTAKKLAGFTPPKAVIDASIRGHATAPIFRDLVAYGGSVVSACQCDSLTWSGTSYPTKALVRVDASTGQPQLWSSDGLYSPSGLKSDQANAAAFGISLYYDAASDALYLAAGGSDFADRFVASTGAAVWHTDTSGSSQAITLFEGQVIDGGHFRWVARTKSQNCGDNANPNFGCIFQPRLVALDPATGVVTPAYTTETTSGGLTRYMERGWGPAICCAYNGTWAITPTSNGLWVGGEITTMGTGWNVNAAATAALPALKYVLDPSQHGGVGRFS